MKNKYGNATRILPIKALVGMILVALVTALFVSISQQVSFTTWQQEKEFPVCQLLPTPSPAPATRELQDSPSAKPCAAELLPAHATRELQDSPPAKSCAAKSLFLGVLCFPNAVHDSTGNSSCGPEKLTFFNGGDNFCRFYTKLGGIVRITQTPWRAAQSVESSVWRDFQGNEDRNAQHYEWFGFYQNVDGKNWDISWR